MLINAFEKQYPGIHVQLVSAPTDTDTNRATLATEISGGSSTPDVFMGDVIWPAQFGAHQLAVPLSDYLPSSYWSKFAPGLVQGATYQGKVYGSPLFEDQGFLYYRKDLLAKAHMAVPTTWQQLETDSVTLVHARRREVRVRLGGRLLRGPDLRLHGVPGGRGRHRDQHRLHPGDAQLPRLDQGHHVHAQPDHLGRQPGRGDHVPGAAGDDHLRRRQRRVPAQLGLRLQCRHDSVQRRQAHGQPGRRGPLPTFAGQPYPGYSNIGGWNMYINPHSTHIAADLTFIQWLSGTTAQDILSERYGFISTVTAVRSNPTVIGSNPVFAVVPKTKLVPRPAWTAEYPALSTAIYENVNGALAGSASPASAASAAQSAASTALTSTASGGL